MIPPKNDAAPLAGGAGVNGPNVAPDPTQVRLTPPARHNAPPGTSGVAAARIAGAGGKLRRRVLDYLIGRGADGATDDEGETALSMKPQTYTPRRGELVALGLAVDSGRRRPTASGRPAAVWVALQTPVRTGVEALMPASTKGHWGPVAESNDRFEFHSDFASDFPPGSPGFAVEPEGGAA